MQVSHSEIDLNLKDIPTTPTRLTQRNSKKEDDRKAEDDVAIAEAIAEVEQELKKSKSPVSLTTVMVGILLLVVFVKIIITNFLDKSP